MLFLQSPLIPSVHLKSYRYSRDNKEKKNQQTNPYYQKESPLLHFSFEVFAKAEGMELEYSSDKEKTEPLHNKILQNSK